MKFYIRAPHQGRGKIRLKGGCLFIGKAFFPAAQLAESNRVLLLIHLFRQMPSSKPFAQSRHFEIMCTKATSVLLETTVNSLKEHGKGTETAETGSLVNEK